MEYIKMVAWLLLAVLAFDGICFFMWILSGQQPQGAFYFGKLTCMILQAIIK